MLSCLVNLDEQFHEFCTTFAGSHFYFSAGLSETHRNITETPHPGAFSDFYGFPTNPFCIYKTGPQWRVRQGPEAYRYLREARPVCDHPIREAWLELGLTVAQYLDAHNVKWSTIDPVRFAEEENRPGALHLWIGVEPETLSFEAARDVGEGCKATILSNFPDIEIAFRHSVYTPLLGPQLLSYGSPFLDPTVGVRSPFTPALGLRIAPRNAPHLEGTGALYIRESSTSDRVLLLTNRHVALPLAVHPKNELYEREHSSAYVGDIILLGSVAYDDAIGAMAVEIGQKHDSIKIQSQGLEGLGEVTEDEDARIIAKHKEYYEKEVERAKRAIAKVDALHSDVTKHWSIFAQRMLGHVIHAPPISVSTGPQKFMEDWALVTIDRDKINWDKFHGNVIHLGDMIKPYDFQKNMQPHADAQGRSESSVEYPGDGLLPVKGFLMEHEMQHPAELDTYDEPFLPVLKNGNATGLTCGRASGLVSFVRTHAADGAAETSIALAVYPYSYKHGAFAAPGDSGSIVVDGRGRVVGLLSSGAGKAHEIDVAYLTPYYWLEQRIKEAFPDSSLY